MPATQLVEDVLAAPWTGDEDGSSTVRYSKTQDDALLSQRQNKLLLAMRSQDPWFTIELEAPHVLKTLKVLSSIKLTRTRILAKRDKHPDVPVDVLRDLPNYLADPLVIYERPKGDEITLVIEAMTKSGEPILIGLRDGQIKTITPKHNQRDKSGAQRLAEEINRGQVIYARNKKALDNARADLGNRTATNISYNRPRRGQGSRKKLVFEGDLVNSHKELPIGASMLFSKQSRRCRLTYPEVRRWNVAYGDGKMTPLCHAERRGSAGRQRLKGSVFAG